MSKPSYWAVVPAAGVGKRMQADRPKQYLPLLDKTVIEQTLLRLLDVTSFTAVVVAITTTDPYWPELPIAQHPKIKTAPGGKERADSVLSCLRQLENVAEANDWVLVHDAARPCITASDIEKLITELHDDTIGGILALASHDTLKQVRDGIITGSVNRQQIWRALTPQMFRYHLLKSALEQAEGNPAVTDEASAIELLGYQPRIIAGRGDNIKITSPEDLALAAFYRGRQ